MGRTSNCTFCGKKAEIWIGHVHIEFCKYNLLLSGFCRKCNKIREIMLEERQSYLNKEEWFDRQLPYFLGMAFMGLEMCSKFGNGQGCHGKWQSWQGFEEVLYQDMQKESEE